MKFKMYKWETFNDGWFEYYFCPHCRHKQQLVIDKIHYLKDVQIAK